MACAVQQFKPRLQAILLDFVSLCTGPAAEGPTGRSGGHAHAHAHTLNDPPIAQQRGGMDGTYETKSSRLLLMAKAIGSTGAEHSDLSAGKKNLIMLGLRSEAPRMARGLVRPGVNVLSVGVRTAPGRCVLACDLVMGPLRPYRRSARERPFIVQWAKTRRSVLDRRYAAPA